MTMRKLFATGLAAVVGVLFVAGDASAFGKRKRNRGGDCNDCGGGYAYHGGGYGSHGGCGDCGGGYAHAYQGDCGGCGTGYATAGAGYPVAGAPQAMPAPGVATNPGTQPGTVTPAAGTEGGTVTPATGTTVVPQTTVIPQQSYVYPAGGYYQGGRYVYPAGGYYQGGNTVYPAGYGSFEGGFGSGVVQGAFGTPNYVPYGSTIGGTIGNYAGQQVGRGLFRRR